jgi:hypothetical protein
MDFKINKIFMQVVDKPKKDLQLHVESYVMPQLVFKIAGNLKCIAWCKLNIMPCC